MPSSANIDESWLLQHLQDPIKHICLHRVSPQLDLQAAVHNPQELPVLLMLGILFTISARFLHSLAFAWKRAGI